jgi:membrane associated rhomboid family serine protease
VVLGALALGTIGAVWPVPPDLTAFSGAVYGFLLGALAGVILDRRRDTP